jgi:hypothetical protein
MNSERTKDGVVVRLDYHEAVVLNELLGRWGQSGASANPDLYEDDSERLVLQSLGASLEPMIDEVFSSDYAAVLDGARLAVRS